MDNILHNNLDFRWQRELWSWNRVLNEKVFINIKLLINITNYININYYQRILNTDSLGNVELRTAQNIAY